MKRIATLIALSLATSAAFAQASADEIQALTINKRAGVAAARADVQANQGAAQATGKAPFSYLTEASPL